MKKLLLPLLIIVALLLTACGTEIYESNDAYFSIKFPKTMTVLSAGQTVSDLQLLADFDLTAEDMEGFFADGGIYYALEKDDTVKNELTISTTENDLASLWWSLPGGDMQKVNELQEEIIDGFTSGGITVLQKGDFRQGRVHCVFVTLSTGAVDGTDAIYMATIANGLQYSVLYQSSAPITPQKEEEIQSIMDTFYVNEGVANPNEEQRDTTVLQAVLILIMILIAIALVVLVVRVIMVHRKKDDSRQIYIPQFEDTINASKKGRKS